MQVSVWFVTLDLKWKKTPTLTPTPPPASPDIRRGFKEKWLDLRLQNRTFSHPDVRETGPLNVHTCYFSPDTCLEWAFLKIPSADLLD